MSLLQRLKHIQEHGPNELDMGICSNANTSHWVTDIFEEWPEYSGHPKFPVSSPEFSDPRQAYFNTPDEDFWSPDHPYGAARLRLLDFLIDTLENNKDLVT